jgi:hypothetical protein
MADGLKLTARALERDDHALASRAIDRLRDLRDWLAELARTREETSHAARGSPVWWGEAGPVVRESENAGQLDLLGGSCLVLARTAASTSACARQELSSALGKLAGTLATLDSWRRTLTSHCLDGGWARR